MTSRKSNILTRERRKSYPRLQTIAQIPVDVHELLAKGHEPSDEQEQRASEQIAKATMQLFEARQPDTHWSRRAYELPEFVTGKQGVVRCQ